MIGNALSVVQLTHLLLILILLGSWFLYTKQVVQLLELVDGGIMVSELVEEAYFRLSLSTLVYHSINDEVVKECGTSLSVFHMYFIQGRINLNSLRSYLKYDKIEKIKKWRNEKFD